MIINASNRLGRPGMAAGRALGEPRRRGLASDAWCQQGRSLTSLFVCRSTALRPRALRPQLKRDPLGACREGSVLRPSPLATILLAACAHHPPPTTQSTPEMHTVRARIVYADSATVDSIRKA